MRDFDDAFSPELSKLCDIPFGENNTHNSRLLFYQLNQTQKSSELISQSYAFINQNLNQVSSSSIIKNYSEDKLLALTPAKIPPLSKQPLTQDNLSFCTEQSAAILLTQPRWLENSFQISVSHTDAAIQLMSCYLQLTRNKQNHINLQQACHALLLDNQIKLPTLHSYTYSQQPELITEMFDFSAIQLALGQFPRIFFAEILGFTLAYCQMPTLIEICFPRYKPPSPFFKLHHQQTKKQISRLHDCIRNYLNLFPQQKQSLWQRVQQGFWLYQQQMQCCRDKLNEVLNKPLSVQQAITNLFQQKTKAAIGHHQKIQLEGKSLDKWFAGMPENSRRFLQVLEQSNYINKDKPENSRLLKLFDFNGAMFGVLDSLERELLVNWLNGSSKNIIGATALAVPCDAKASAPIEETRPQKNYSPLTNKELYYYLINADIFPDVLPTAQTKTRKLLQTCALFSRLPFKHYSHQQFNNYINTIYQREMKAYQPLQGKPKISKQAYIWGIEQIAPMILIDGCWLQNSLSLQNSHPEISEILFKIYGDEVGNGHIKQNHPYIFQQLLNSLSIQLPPVYSPNFIKHSRFINSAFDLPVYMLSLSHFSVEFLPELLGLNMAIELSGLGKSYMQLVDEWEYWGIDSSIAKIHISIDNVASGHTFLAKKAIQLYLDDILQKTANRAIVDNHWRRIYNGYASLRLVGTAFKFEMPIKYLINKLANSNS